MPSFQNFVMQWFLRWKRFQRRNESLNIAVERARFEAYKRFIPVEDVTVTRIGANGVPCEWIIPQEVREDRIIYFIHGGGYVMGSNEAYRGLMSKIAKVCKAKLLTVEYALAPEQPFPMALSQITLVYEWLQRQVKDEKIITIGDSAGGGLVLSLFQKLREESIPLPSACVLIAPWVDMELKQPSIERLAKQDVILSKKRLAAAAKLYAGDVPKDNSYLSPINADFTGFPPTLIQLGTHDILLDEGKLLAKKMEAAGVDVQLEIWEKMIHVWHIVGDRVPEAVKAINQIATYVAAKQ